MDCTPITNHTIVTKSASAPQQSSPPFTPAEMALLKAVTYAVAQVLKEEVKKLEARIETEVLKLENRFLTDRLAEERGVSTATKRAPSTISMVKPPSLIA